MWACERSAGANLMRLRDRRRVQRVGVREVRRANLMRLREGDGIERVGVGEVRGCYRATAAGIGLKSDVPNRPPD